MKRLMVKLALLSPLLLGMILVNYVVDPAHLFGGRFERELAQRLLQGQTVANVYNYDERQMLRCYAAGLPERKDVIVLGSSRSMLIGADEFPGRTFFNSCVSGASLEDYMAIYDLFWRRGFRPSVVVLGVDPWIFNVNHGQIRWKSIGDAYCDLLAQVHPGERPAAWQSGIEMSKLGELISPAYCQASLRALRRGLSGGAPGPGRSYVATNDAPEQRTVRPDGVEIYELKERIKTSDEVTREVRASFAKGPLYSLGGFTQVDPGLKALFEDFVGFLQTNGVEVVFFLSPYHPLAYERITNAPEYGAVGHVESCLRQLASKRHIEVLGTYDPAKAGLGFGDFYDSIHPKPDAVASLWRNRLGQDGRSGGSSSGPETGMP